MQASVHTFDEDTGAGSVLLDGGREVPFAADVFARSALLRLRAGQRVSVEVGDGALTRLWLVGIGPGETIR